MMKLGVALRSFLIKTQGALVLTLGAALGCSGGSTPDSPQAIDGGFFDAKTSDAAVTHLFPLFSCQRSVWCTQSNPSATVSPSDIEATLRGAKIECESEGTFVENEPCPAETAFAKCVRQTRIYYYQKVPYGETLSHLEGACESQGAAWTLINGIAPRAEVSVLDIQEILPKGTIYPDIPGPPCQDPHQDGLIGVTVNLNSLLRTNEYFHALCLSGVSQKEPYWFARIDPEYVYTKVADIPPAFTHSSVAGDFGIAQIGTRSFVFERASPAGGTHLSCWNCNPPQAYNPPPGISIPWQPILEYSAGPDPATVVVTDAARQTRTISLHPVVVPK